jgi:hypothetical protein
MAHCEGETMKKTNRQPALRIPLTEPAKVPEGRFALQTQLDIRALQIAMYNNTGTLVMTDSGQQIIAAMHWKQLARCAHDLVLVAQYAEERAKAYETQKEQQL